MYQRHVAKPCLLFFFIILGVLLFKVNIVEAHASKFVVQNYLSVEARQILLRLYAEGELSDAKSEFVIEQTSNGKFFKIVPLKYNNSLLIRLIPKYNDEYRFPSIGSWELTFEEEGEIDNITYYLQSNSRHKVLFKPYNNSTEVTVIIEDYSLYEEILIPLSLRNLFKMPLHQFLLETEQLLYWDWVFPERRFNHVNEKSRNLSSYLGQQFIEDKEKRLNNLFDDSMFVLNDLARSQFLAQRRINETAYIKRNIDHIMQYMGTDLVDGSMFEPYDVNKEKIAVFNEEYLTRYIQNVVGFLSQFPDYYTSVKELDTPFFQDEELTQLDVLYTQLYLMTTKNPGLWFIVPIQKISQEGEQTRATTISMELLIPYFKLDGTFELYGYDNIQQYLNDQNVKDDNVTYFYKDIGVLRVPNKHAKTNLTSESVGD